MSLPAIIRGGVASNVRVPPVAVSRIKIFVRPSGSDLTGNGSALSPLRSVTGPTGALFRLAVLVPMGLTFVIDGTGCYGADAESVPVGYQWPMYISPAGFTTIPAFVPDFFPFGEEAPITLQGIPVTADTITAPEVTATAVNADSRVVSITTTKNYTADQYKGFLLYSESDGDVAAIIGVSAGPNSQIEYESAFGPLTPPLLIAECGLDLRNTDATSIEPTIRFNNSQSAIALNGVAISHANPASNAVGPRFSELVQVSAIGCQWAGIFFDSAEPRRADLYGMVFTDGKETRLDGAPCFIRNTLFDRSVYKNALGGANAAGVQEWSSVAFVGCGPVGMIGSTLSTPVLTWTNILVRNGSGNGINLRPGLSLHKLDHVLVESCAGDGLMMEAGAMASLAHVRGTPTGAGLRLGPRALALPDASTDIAGAGGQIIAGTLASRTWVDFHTNPPINNQIDNGATGSMAQVYQS